MTPNVVFCFEDQGVAELGAIAGTAAGNVFATGSACFCGPKDNDGVDGGAQHGNKTGLSNVFPIPLCQFSSRSIL